MSYERNRPSGPIIGYKTDDAIYLYTSTIPKPTLPFEARLAWRAIDTKSREKVAEDELVVRTDRIRAELLPRYHQKGIDLYTQIRLIHRAHVKGQEHLIFTPSQAKRILEEKPPIRHLAGKVRSADLLPVNVSQGYGVARNVSYHASDIVLNRLTQQAEILFPLHESNPTVTQKNIYHVLSAFQYLLSLDHPFYEANGRTSEDAMYALWQRRPDLAHTVRYISTDGRRRGKRVNTRCRMLDRGAISMVQRVGYRLGLTREESQTITNYADLVNIVRRKLGYPREIIASKYSQHFDLLMLTETARLTDVGYWKHVPIVNQLAQQLKRGSTTYTMKDGTQL